MKESVIYQEWIETATAEGMAKGLAQGRERGLAEGRAEGRAEGVKEEEAKLLLKQLDRRFGPIPQPITLKIQNLSLDKLEELGEALLDFTDINNLTAWLEAIE